MKIKSNYFKLALLSGILGWSLLPISCQTKEKNANQEQRVTEESNSQEGAYEAKRQELRSEILSLGETDDVRCEDLVNEYMNFTYNSEINAKAIPFDIDLGLFHREGSKALVLDESDNEIPKANPSQYTHCIINGRVYPVKFIDKQQKKEGSSGRVTEDNFNNMSGSIYSVENIQESSVSKEESSDIYPFFCKEDFIKEYTIIPMASYPRDEWSAKKPYYTKANYQDLQHITEWVEKEYNGQVSQFHIASKSADGKLTTYVISVDRPGPVAIGLVVLSNEGELSFLEQFAVKNEESVWRIDDGGIYYGSDTVFALKDKAGNLRLFNADCGFEGINFFFLSVEGKFLLQKPPMWDYYTAPM